MWAAPAVSDDGTRVLFAADDLTVYCLRASDGVLQWTTTTMDNSIQNVTPLVVGQSVYIAAFHGVGNLFLTNGSINWVNYNVLGSRTPALFGSQLCFSGASTVTCLSAATGALQWSSYLGISGASPSTSPMISADGTTVIVGATDSQLYAFNTQTGIMLWTFNTNADEVLSSPSGTSGGLFYFGDSVGYVRGVWVANGTEAWRYRTLASSSGIQANPAIANDGSMIIGESGYLLVPAA
jgi:outer membrane protein assembly factor BamB